MSKPSVPSVNYDPPRAIQNFAHLTVDEQLAYFADVRRQNAQAEAAADLERINPTVPGHGPIAAAENGKPDGRTDELTLKERKANA